MFLSVLMIALAVVSPVEAINPTQTIISSYNLHDFDKLYSFFSDNLKSKITAEQLRSSMYTIYGKLGQIYDYHPLISGQLFCVHETNLDTSVFRYNMTLNQQQFDSFVISFAPQSTYQFFKEGPLRNRSSLSFWTPAGHLDINSDKLLSVCSVYKITLVLEYARQSSEGDINPQACIPLDYINRYYLTHVDSGHKSWLETITGECAKLDDIVIGMIKFSSNANAQYLTDLLNPDNIDRLISNLNMNHSKTLYVVSSMLALNNTKQLPYNDYINYIKTLTPEWTRQQSILIHNALKDKTLVIKDEFYLDAKVIDVHVELLEKSTTSSYRVLMQKIASGYFPTGMNNVIYQLFDAVDMTSEFSKMTFVHSGAKGGSANYPAMTNAALAVAGYAILRNSTNGIGYSITYNGLDTTTFANLLTDMNLFILGLEISEYFVVELVKRLQSKQITV